MKKRVQQAHTYPIALFTMILLLFSVIACAHAEPMPKKVTVMVYMCGSNLESENAAATRVLGEMRASRFNLDEVNVVALLGGSTRWWSGYDSSKLTLIQVDGSRKPPIVIPPMDWASMGDPNTLSSFLDYCHKAFPAERYILVLWDHGGGPNEGVCYDRISEKKIHRTDTLTTPELESALNNSPFANQKLDMIVFHACLMGSAEVATRIASFARYMVASEEINYGIGYSWLKGLENDPDALETAKRIVDASYVYNKDKNDHLANVFAAVDLMKMPRLNDALDAFFSHISEFMAQGSFASFSNALMDVETFGVSEDGSDNCSDLVDLGDLVEKYRFAVPDYADGLLSALQEAVVYCQSTSASCTGLSVYHPYSNKYGVNILMPVYNSLGFSEGYTTFVQQFAGILCGAPLSDWTDLNITCDLSNRAESAQFRIALSESQTSSFKSATIDVLQRMQDGAYRFACVSNDVISDGSSVTGEFKNIALYAVDAAGNPISDALEYHLADDGYYMIPAVLSRAAGEILNEEGDIEAAWDAGSCDVLIACTPDAETNKLIPRNVMIRDEATGRYVTLFDASFNDYQKIRLDLISRWAPAKTIDPIPPFSQWEVASTSTWEADIDGSWSFRLLENQLPMESLCISYQITDTQNNTYSSARFSLIPHKDEYMLSYDDEAFDIEVDSFHLTIRDTFASPEFIIRYKQDREVYMTLENVQIDGMDVEGQICADGAPRTFMQGDRISFSVKCSLPPEFDGDIESMNFDIKLLDAKTDAPAFEIPVRIMRG